MLPREYLIPCVRAISELVQNYGCTAVLCTATQPALQKLFPPEIRATEIMEDVPASIPSSNAQSSSQSARSPTRRSLSGWEN